MTIVFVQDEPLKSELMALANVLCLLKNMNFLQLFGVMRGRQQVQFLVKESINP